LSFTVRLGKYNDLLFLIDHGYAVVTLYHAVT
jgi:hypothetical protein